MTTKLVIYPYRLRDTATWVIGGPLEQPVESNDR